MVVTRCSLCDYQPYPTIDHEFLLVNLRQIYCRIANT